jgi:hypothetical protein
VTIAIVVVFALAAVAPLSRVIFHGSRATAPSGVELLHKEAQRYEEGEIVAVDPERQRIELRVGVGSSSRQIEVEITPETRSTYGDAPVGIDQIRPGDHATVRFARSSRNVAEELRLAR